MWAGVLHLKFFGALNMVMTENQIKTVVALRGWSYNACSAYLAETGLSPYMMAKVMGCGRSNLNYWLHSESLSSSVNFLFLTLRKIWRMSGMKVSDLY